MTSNCEILNHNLLYYKNLKKETVLRGQNYPGLKVNFPQTTHSCEKIAKLKADLGKKLVPFKKCF